MCCALSSRLAASSQGRFCSAMRRPSALIATFCLCHLASAVVIEHVAPHGRHGGLTKTPRDKEFWHCAEIAKHTDSNAIDATVFWLCMAELEVVPLQLSFLHASIDELHVLARGPVLPFIEKDRAHCISELNAVDQTFIDQAAVVVRSIVAATMRQPIGAIDVFQMMIVSLCNFLDKHDATFDYTALELSGYDYIGHVMEVLSDMTPFHTSNIGFDDALSDRATTTISNLKQFGLIVDIQLYNLDTFHFEDPEDYLFSQEDTFDCGDDNTTAASMTTLEPKRGLDTQSDGFYTCTTSYSIKNLSELAPKTHSLQPNCMFANDTAEQDLEKALSLLFQNTNEDQGSSKHSTIKRTFPYPSRQTGRSNQTTPTFSHAKYSSESSFKYPSVDSGSEDDTDLTQTQMPKNTSSLQFRGLQGPQVRRTFASQWNSGNQTDKLELQLLARNVTTSGSLNLPSSSTATTTRQYSYTGSDTLLPSNNTSSLPQNLNVTRTPLADQSTGTPVQSSSTCGSSKSDTMTDKTVESSQTGNTQSDHIVNKQTCKQLQFKRKKVPQNTNSALGPASDECSLLTRALKTTSSLNLNTVISLEHTTTTTSASCGSDTLNAFPNDNGRSTNSEHFKVGRYNPKEKIVQDIFRTFEENNAALSGVSAKYSNRNIPLAPKSRQLSHSDNTEPTDRSSTPGKIFKTVSLNQSGHRANFPIKRSLEIPIVPIKSVASNDEDRNEEEMAQVDFDEDHFSESDNELEAKSTMPNLAEENQIASGSKVTTPEVDESLVFLVSESFIQPSGIAAYKSTLKKDEINSAGSPDFKAQNAIVNGYSRVADSHSLGSNPNATHVPEVPNSAPSRPKRRSTKNAKTETAISSGILNSKPTIKDSKLTPDNATTSQGPNSGTAPSNAILPHTTNTHQPDQTSTKNANTNLPSPGKTNDKEETVIITGPPRILSLNTAAAKNDSNTKKSKSDKHENEPRTDRRDNNSSKRNSNDDWEVFRFED